MLTMRRFYRIASTMAVVLGLAVTAVAQEKAKASIAAALEKAMTPGEGQKKLGFMVGTFDAKIRTWATPSDPPAENIGVSQDSPRSLRDPAASWRGRESYLEKREEKPNGVVMRPDNADNDTDKPGE
jgi:hypothetical protein